MNPQPLAELERQLGIEFNDRALLEESLRHTSFLMEHPDEDLRSNERLEFLGDAVLGYLAAEYLYHAFPDAGEGYLTMLRSGIIRGTALARFAEDLHLDRYLFIGRGLAAEMGIGKSKLPADLRPRQRVLGRVMESLIGAILVDQGLDAVRALVLPYLERSTAEEIANVPPPSAEASADVLHDPAVALMIKNGNYKTALQEVAQKTLRVTPRYVLTRSSGLPHALVFEVEVRIGNKVIATGKGLSKQRATQAAAKTALERWREFVNEV